MEKSTASFNMFGIALCIILLMIILLLIMAFMTRNIPKEGNEAIK